MLHVMLCTVPVKLMTWHSNKSLLKLNEISQWKTKTNSTLNNRYIELELNVG